MTTAEATTTLSEVLLTGTSIALPDPRLGPRLFEQLQLASKHGSRRLWEEAGLALGRAYRLLGARPPVTPTLAEQGFLWCAYAHPIQRAALQPARRQVD